MIPAVAIALNLLSVGAAYGLLVLVFQKGVGNGLLRLPAGRHGRGVGAALPLLRPLRPLDGLPGLPAQPDQGALRPDRRHRRRRRLRRRLDRAADHRRRADHHRRLRRLRGRRPRHVPADGLRRRRRPSRRRHDRPLRPRPGEHEAPRRLELVPPLLAQLAPGSPRRRTRRRRAGHHHHHQAAREPYPATRQGHRSCRPSSRAQRKEDA